MANPVIAGIKDVGSRVFGGYAELLRIPHTARYAIGAVIAKTKSWSSLLA